MSQELLDKIQACLDKPLIPLETVSNISKTDFYNNYIKKKKPVKLKGMMEHWDARKKWSIEYFEEIGKNKSTYIAKGNIRQGETSWEYGSFLEYLNKIKNYENTGQKAIYLSNLSILKLFPELKNDVDFSMLSDYKIKDSMSLFIGHKGSITGFHQDRADNILAQVKGHKLWLLVDLKQTKYMHVSKKFEPGSNLSEIDFDNYNRNIHPEIQNADIYYAIIGPGEMIFNPKNWWHCVYSIDTSISVNCLSYTQYDLVEGKFKSASKIILHNMGLYGKECTCHYIDENGKRQSR